MRRFAAALVPTLVLFGASAASAETDIGLQLDAGLPDGVTGSLVVRPTPRWRLHAGGGHNMIGPGVRGGLSVVAFPYWITPSASLEAGRYFSGDANPLARRISGDASLDEPALRDVGYDWASAHLGLELGYDRVTFYVHGGMSMLWTQVSGIETRTSDDASMDGPTIEIRRDPKVRLTAPSARTGLIVYF